MAIDYSEIFPIEEYYRKVVQKIDPKRFRFGTSGKMVCPLHNDNDPSLGIIPRKSGSKGETYHCFGCGARGNIVRFHQEIRHKYFRMSMSDVESVKDLCRIFGADYSTVPKEEDIQSSDRSLDSLMDEAINRFSFSDFQAGFLKGKQEGQELSYYNMLVLNMINEMKNTEGRLI